MAVTLNLKSNDSLPVKLKSTTPLTKVEIEMLECCDLYYQSHCFDLLYPTKNGRIVSMRFTYQKTGALMSGMLGATLALELKKGLRYALKHMAEIITVAEGNSCPFDTVTEVPTSVGNVEFSVNLNYADFLTAIGDVKAIPAGMKKVMEAEVVPVDEKGNEYNADAAAADFIKASEDVYAEETYKVKVIKQAAAIKKTRLSVANILGQPVIGTETGSVYTVIGLGTTINLAARCDLKSNTLSFRIEPRKGSGFTTSSSIAQALKQVGFSLHTAPDGAKVKHASAHLEIKTAAVIGRIQGAILGDLIEYFPPYRTRILTLT